MKLQRVVWYEGMKLNPHHFQQIDRYNQYYINSRINILNSNYWGLTEIQIDLAALSGGSFNLVKCTGIMPDGLLFDMPANDPFPKSRSFEDMFAATAEKMDVFLSIPVENISGNNCQMDDGINSNNSRYILQNTEVLDYNTGSNMRTIGIVKPNFQFKFEEESLEDFNSIKIGQINRSADGKYTMDKNFIVSSVSISASEVLLNYTREILGSLVSKSKELRKLASIHKPELSLTQVEILLMLQTVNTYIPLLNYYYSSKNIHPETLYILFLNLAGQLSTYSNLGIKTGEFPAYEHKHLTEIFSQVVNEINSMLNVQKTIERRDIIIPLRKQADTLFVGQLSPAQISSQFFISVISDIPEKKIITEIPKNIKISAYEEIFAVHQAGIQGVSIEYIARPPVGVQVNERAHYFKINKEGRFWDKIEKKNNIAFFIAAEFKSMQMELVLLMPGD
jgi:type VI secretion system protein ImpJ